MARKVTPARKAAAIAVARIVGLAIFFPILWTILTSFRTEASNPALGDTVARLCQDGSNRRSKFLLPTVSDAVKRGAPVEGLTLEIAFWSRYCASAADSGVDLQDPRSNHLISAAQAARSDPMAFLGFSEIFGGLCRCKQLADASARQLDDLWSRGPREALHRFFDGVEA